MNDASATVGEILRGAPDNWHRWGPDDEVGALNFLGPEEAIRGVQAVRSGKTFTLQVPIGDPEGDPVWPGPRRPAQRINIRDKGDYLGGAVEPWPGGIEFADDIIIMPLQGSSQYDALGHAWHDDQLYNGYSASTTTGSMTKAGILPIAERGVVGRGILLDVARHRGKPWLSHGEPVSHLDLQEVAAAQGTEIEPRDILLLRTGWLEFFKAVGREEFYGDAYNEPGLVYSRDMVQWFHDMEIPCLATDTLANEVTDDPETGVKFLLHSALMRNLGVTFAEIISLEALAADCAADGQYTFLYTAAPLKVHGGTGAPVNPVVVK